MPRPLVKPLSWWGSFRLHDLYRKAIHAIQQLPNRTFWDRTDCPGDVYHVYVARKASGALYVGQTRLEPSHRLRRHQRNGARLNEILAWVQFATRFEAFAVETSLRRLLRAHGYQVEATATPARPAQAPPAATKRPSRPRHAGRPPSPPRGETRTFQSVWETGP